MSNKKPRENVRNDKKRPKGRPTKYDEKYCQMIIDYFTVPTTVDIINGKGFEETVANEFPTFQAFAHSIDVHTDTLLEWCSVHKEFSVAHTRAKQLQESIWLKNGMTGRYNPQFAKFFGVNCLGYKEKIETENTNTNTNKNIDLSNLTDEQIDKILNGNDK